MNYNKFYSKLNRIDRNRFHQLLRKTAKNNIDLNNGFLNELLPSFKEKIAYLYDLAFNKLYEYYHNREEIRYCFIDNYDYETIKTYELISYYEKDSRVAIKFIYDVFINHQNENIQIYCNDDYTKINVHIRVFKNKKMNEFTNEYIELATIIHAINKNYIYDLLDGQDIEIDQIMIKELFLSYYAEKYQEKILEKLNFAKEYKLVETIKFLTELELYHIFMDALWKYNQTCYGKNLPYIEENYEDFDIYTAIDLIVDYTPVSFYNHYLNGCDQNAVFPEFFKQQICLYCNREIKNFKIAA